MDKPIDQRQGGRPSYENASSCAGFNLTQQVDYHLNPCLLIQLVYGFLRNMHTLTQHGLPAKRALLAYAGYSIRRVVWRPRGSLARARASAWPSGPRGLESRLGAALRDGFTTVLAPRLLSTNTPLVRRSWPTRGQEFTNITGRASGKRKLSQTNKVISIGGGHLLAIKVN